MERQIPMINKQDTAKRIRYFMNKNNLKPIDIQKYLSLTCVQTVYRWLEGVNVPTIDNLYAMSQLFGIRIDDMIAGNRMLKKKSFAVESMGRLYAYYSELIRAVA